MRKLIVFAVLALLASVFAAPALAQTTSTCSVVYTESSESWSFTGCSSDEILAFQDKLNGDSPNATPEAQQSETCLSSDQAELAIFGEHTGLPYLVRVSTESCTWQVNLVPNSLFTVLPFGWMGTLHLNEQEDAKVFIGDGSSYNVMRGTFRFVAGFDPDDVVNRPCDLWAAEDKNGQSQTSSFHVERGNFACDTYGNATMNNTPTPTPVSTDAG